MVDLLVSFIHFVSCGAPPACRFHCAINDIKNGQRFLFREDADLNSGFVGCGHIVGIVGVGEANVKKDDARRLFGVVRGVGVDVFGAQESY